jgi:hypothetical protein
MRTEHLERFTRAFFETGRGLIVGQGMTALSQAAIALVAFLSLGVPRALALGLLTGVAALVPMLGPALVWAPVAAGLALAGRTGAAAVLLGVGVLIIGSVDNLARPIFARYAHLELPTVVLLVSIFGGLSVMGPAVSSWDRCWSGWPLRRSASGATCSSAAPSPSEVWAGRECVGPEGPPECWRYPSVGGHPLHGLPGSCRLAT